MPTDRGTYTISELSREFGITTRTIRHYEDIGLFTPVRRGQTRIFSNADRTKLKLILRGKRLGLSLPESRDIINMYEPGQNNAQQLLKTIETITHQRNRLTRQLEDINKMLQDLARAETGCRAELETIRKPRDKKKR